MCWTGRGRTCAATAALLAFDRVTLEDAEEYGIARLLGVFLVLTMMVGPKISPEGVVAEERRGKAVADLARESGIEHLVYSSLNGASARSGIPYYESKARVEEHIHALRLPATILRPVPSWTISPPTMESDGSCDIQSAGTATSMSGATFEEETQFSPQTCQEQILTGTLTAADLTTLAGLSANPNVAPDTVAVSDSAAASSSASPATTYYQKAYVKTAWIDPFTITITITSLADNLEWPLYGAGGTLNARVNPYQFKYDGWSSPGPSKIKFVTLAGNTGWRVNETDAFTNTDFAGFVYVGFGVAGWIACGSPLTATAHFNHNVTVYGYRNNSRGWAWNDNKPGACTDLVHHGGWDGFGWTS